jgi:hypothetical protein
MRPRQDITSRSAVEALHRSAQARRAETVVAVSRMIVVLITLLD